jgi:hypothetical protein
MDEIVIGELKATLEREGAGALVVRFAGRSASREADVVLEPLFARVTDVANAERRGVVLRFDGLEYFNSSTIAALVRFIRLRQEAGLGLEIVYDGRRRWQKMSFDALRRAVRPVGPAGAVPGVTFRES